MVATPSRAYGTPPQPLHATKAVFYLVAEKRDSVVHVCEAGCSADGGLTGHTAQGGSTSPASAEMGWLAGSAPGPSRTRHHRPGLCWSLRGCARPAGSYTQMLVELARSGAWHGCRGLSGDLLLVCCHRTHLQGCFPGVKSSGHDVTSW